MGESRGGLFLPVKGYFGGVLLTHDMSGFVAHDLSGLLRSPQEVTDEADGDATGDPEDAI